MKKFIAIFAFLLVFILSGCGGTSVKRKVYQVTALQM
ncbi:lipoprotein [Lederbergia ruris]